MIGSETREKIILMDWLNNVPRIPDRAFEADVFTSLEISSSDKLLFTRET
jgi:hypothetical protein